MRIVFGIFFNKHLHTICFCNMSKRKIFASVITAECYYNKTHQFDMRQRQVGINDAKVQTFPKPPIKNK